MVEIIPSQINFSKLLSHTFPGIFTAFGISMIFYILFSDNINGDFHIINIFQDWKIFIGAIGGLVFFGTIIGIIIDSFHHTIEQIIIDDVIVKKIGSAKKIADEIKCRETEIFINLDKKQVKWFYFIGFLPLERFRHLTDNYYSYEECELNLSISFFFSAFIYSYFSYICECGLLTAGIVFFILLTLSIYCFYSGTKHHLLLKLMRIDFIQGALEHQIPFHQKRYDENKQTNTNIISEHQTDATAFPDRSPCLRLTNSCLELELY